MDDVETIKFRNLEGDYTSTRADSASATQDLRHDQLAKSIASFLRLLSRPFWFLVFFAPGAQ